MDSLIKAMQVKAKSSVKKEVLSTVKGKMQQAINRTVYSVYAPIRYERRGFGDGGLGSAGSITGEIQSESTDGFKFSIYNTAVASDKKQAQVYLAPLIIMGQEWARHNYALKYYSGSEHLAYGKPRDFLTETKNTLSLDDLGMKLKRDMER